MTARWLLPTVVALAAVVAEAAEDSTSSHKPPEAFRYRRVYAPVDRMEQWPHARQRLVPIQAEEFERLAALARVLGTGSQVPAGAALASAEYQARMDGDNLVDGEATFNIVYTASRPVMLALEPCGLAIRDSHWADDAGRNSRLALSSDGKTRLLVERSGNLRWTWSLRGRREPGEGVVFDLQMPACPASHLTLDLPADMVPLADRGIVLSQPDPAKPAGRWRIELGGNSRLGLRVISQESLKAAAESTRVQQFSDYECSLHGLDLSTRIAIDVEGEPLRKLSLVLDPGLKLVAARCGGEPLSISPPAPLPDGKSHRVVLELPEPSRSLCRTITLGAIGPVELDAPWRLPSIRPEGVFWQEGGATLSVVRPIALDRFQTISGRHVLLAPLPASRSGEKAEVQFFAPDAAVEVVLSRPQAAIDVDAGASIELSGTQMAARTAALLRVTQGEQFHVEADISPAWTIDSVETFPADAMGEWSVQREGDSPQRLTVQLARPLTPSRPIQLAVTGRWLQSPLNGPLPLGQLWPVAVQGNTGQRLLSISAGEAYRLDASNVEPAALADAKRLSPELLALLRLPKHGFLVRMDGEPRGAISLLAERPRYRGSIRVEATVSARTLTEAYTLLATPDDCRLDKLLVDFRPARGEPLRWDFGPAGKEWAEARRVAPGDSEPKDRERWEIVLRRPATEPVELHAMRVSPRDSHGTISMAALPEAASQRGTLVACCGGAESVALQGRLLEPVPTRPAPGEQFSDTKATCRYDPTLLSSTELKATLSVTPAGEASTAGAWVWSRRLESWYDGRGVGRHLATFRVQNNGRAQITLTLPEVATLADVDWLWVNGTRARWQPVAGADDRKMSIELPDHRRYVTVTLRFAATEEQAGMVRTLRPAMPEVDLPAMAGQWTLWLPPGYEVRDRDPSSFIDRVPAETALQRLFGPLGRSAGDRPFDPLSRQAWSEMAELPGGAADGVATQFLTVLGSHLRRAASIGQREVPWGKLLADPGLSSPPTGRADSTKWRLLIDEPALARAGITPAALIPKSEGESTLLRGAMLLDRADLAILVQDRLMLLTNLDEAAVYRWQLEPSDNGLAWRILPGGLADRVRLAAETAGDFVPADRWNQRPTPPSPPWHAPALAGCLPADSQGWTAYRLELAQDAPPTIVAAHTPALDALGWAAFLAVAAVSCWVGRNRPGRLIRMAALFALLSLILPETYQALPNGAFLGALCGLALGMTHRRLSTVEQDSHLSHVGPSTGSSRTSAAIGAMVLVAVLGQAGSVHSAGDPAATSPPASVPDTKDSANPAANTTPTPAPSVPPAVPTTVAPAAAKPAVRPKVQDVFIPVDESTQPVGDKYYISEGFYTELHRRATPAMNDPCGFSLSEATYRGVLAWESNPDRLTLTELRALYEIQVFEPNTQVRLRLGQPGTNLVPDGSTLDGRTISPEWQEDGRVLAVDVPEPGQYYLELSLLPAVNDREAASGFDLPIPRLATSRLELSIPSDAPEISVPTAVGLVTHEFDPPRVTAELGPTDRLSVRWPGGTVRSPSGLVIDVEELFWLKVQPGSVVLDARLKYHVVEGLIRELVLAGDARLRPLPLPAGSPVAAIHALPGSPQMFHLELAQASGSDVDVRLSFLVAGASGVGRLKLPRVTSLAARPTQRWMAVSVDDDLAVPEDAFAGLETLGAQQFSTAWGVPVASPQTAFNMAALPPTWFLPTRPLPPATTADQTTAVSFGLQSAQVTAAASLETSAGDRVEYRVSVPKNMKVNAVSLKSDGVQKVARWSRTDDGTVRVLLVEPVRGKQEFLLQGELPLADRDHVAWPAIALEDVALESHTARIYRKPEVLVEIRWPQELPEATSPTNHEDTLPGRLVRHFKFQGKVPEGAGFSVQANQPEVVASQLTRVRLDKPQPEAEVAFDLEVKRGIVDELRLRVPPSWPGVFLVDPPATVRVQPVPGETQLRVVIVPEASIIGKCRLRVSGPLRTAAGEPLCVPQVGLEGVQVEQHLVILPTQSPTEQAAWETRGLRDVPIPKEAVDPADTAEAVKAFQVEGEHFYAVKRPLHGAAQVHLADVCLSWLGDGVYQGVAAVDLEAAAMHDCVLRLPTGSRLIQVCVAGVAVNPVPLDDGGWRLPLCPGRLPQRLEVVFRGVLKRLDAQRLEIESPLLEGIPLRQILWTIGAPPSLERPSAQRALPVDSLEQAMIRLRNAAVLAELTEPVSGEEPEEFNAWHARWLRRWTSAQRSAQRELALLPEGERKQQCSAKLADLEQKATQAVRRFKQAAGNRPDDVEPTTVDDLAALWLETVQRPHEVTRFLSTDGASTLTLVCRTRPGTGIPWSAIALVGVVTVVSLAGTASGSWARLFVRWPQLVGVLAGLAWWLWLRPSVLGWLIVLATLAAAFRSGWKTPKPSKSNGLSGVSRRR